MKDHKGSDQNAKHQPDHRAASSSGSRVAGLAVIAVLSAGVPSARASAAPKVYVVTQSMGCCYLHPAIKPRTIVLGSEWGVGADFGEGTPRGPMHWTTWSASKGYGTGEFWAALFPGQELAPARVTLTNVKVHDGRRTSPR